MTETPKPKTAKPKTAKLWGGRFAGEVDPTVDRYTRSLPFDRTLIRDDLIGSLAHARMLWECSVLDDDSARPVLAGLSQMLREVEERSLAVEGDDEDVHSWIERQLSERIGEPARRLHTGRSRNDQVATALRLYVRRQVETTVGGLVVLLEALRERASLHLETWLPGYTHLQRGQPVSLAHHLLAHLWSLAADARRLQQAHHSAGTSPLGAAALAGTPHDIDPLRTAELLGLPRVFANSMWAVADRDYVVEASFACALLMAHLSRWAEEVVLWSSAEFGFAVLGDEIAKGSSIMPQKRNPEPAELLRGKSGRAIGDLVAHLVQLKGLPLTYNSDLQEDKQALFDAFDTASSSVEVSTVLVRGLHYRPERLAAALRGGFVTATDLADGLVRRGVPFRDAHHQTGLVVRYAEEQGCELWELTVEALREICPLLDRELIAALQPEASVRAHASAGGPAPARVAEQLEQAGDRIQEIRHWLESQPLSPIYRAHQDGRLLDEPKR